MKQQAVALSVRRSTSPADFASGQPGERVWQALAEAVAQAAAELSAGSSTAVETAIGTPTARPRPATTAETAAIATELGKVGAEVGKVGTEVGKVGTETRRVAALSLLSTVEKEGTRTGEPKTPAQAVLLTT